MTITRTEYDILKNGEKIAHVKYASSADTLFALLQYLQSEFTWSIKLVEMPAPYFAITLEGIHKGECAIYKADAQAWIKSHPAIPQKGKWLKAENGYDYLIEELETKIIFKRVNP